MPWNPREIKDDDKSKKFPMMRHCPKHGDYCGKFCLRCRLEQLGLKQVSGNGDRKDR